MGIEPPDTLAYVRICALWGNHRTGRDLPSSRGHVVLPWMQGTWVDDLSRTLPVLRFYDFLNEQIHHSNLLPSWDTSSFDCRIIQDVSLTVQTQCFCSSKRIFFLLFLIEIHKLITILKPLKICLDFFLQEVKKAQSIVCSTNSGKRIFL